MLGVRCSGHPVASDAPFKLSKLLGNPSIKYLEGDLSSSCKQTAKPPQTFASATSSGEMEHLPPSQPNFTIASCNMVHPSSSQVDNY